MQDEELTLWKRYYAGDENGRDELILHYLYLVKGQVRIAGPKMPWVSEEDLMQEGVRGLITAITNYDFSLGSDFEAYAEKGIYGTVVRNAEVGRDMTRRQHENYRKVREAHDALMEELDRKPTHEEIVEKSGLSSLQVENALSASHISFAEEIPDDYSESAARKNVAAIEDGKVLIRELLLHLNDKEIMIVIDYYWVGLIDREIAEKYAMNEEAAKKTRQRAIEKMNNLIGG